jgi:hypothetical protein
MGGTYRTHLEDGFCVKDFSGRISSQYTCMCACNLTIDRGDINVKWLWLGYSGGVFQTLWLWLGYSGGVFQTLWFTWSHTSIKLRYQLGYAKDKGKAVPLQAWSGPEGSKNLRLPDFLTTAQDDGNVVSLTHRPHLPPGNAPGTHFY